MEVVILIALLGGVVGLIGGVCGLIGLIYVRKQTRLLQQQVDTVLKQDTDYAEWAGKLEQAVEALTRICGRTVNTGPSVQAGLAVVFPNENLRKRIDRHIGHAAFWGKFKPIRLSRDQLLSPVVKKLIQEVLDTTEKFKKEHTDWARSLKLLPAQR